MNEQKPPSDIEKIAAYLEKQVIDLGYGTITVNVIIKEGNPQFNTLQITKQKRIKYTYDKR